MTRKRLLRRQRRTLRRTIPPKIAEIENDLRTNAAVFEEDGFDAPYVAAAYYLIANFISRDVADEYWGPVSGTMTHEIASGLVTLGEVLFRLKRTPGLLEFCARIRERRPRPPFYNEALAASVFLDYGFKIRAIEEAGIKGLDFDFRAKKNGASVCVEVTSLTQPTFSDNTLKNALNAEMGQLPKDKPNVIVCMIPEKWYDEADALQRLHRQARRLFGASKRINAVVYVGEQHDTVEIGDQQLGTLQYRFTSVLNETARNPCDELFFLTEMEGEEIVRSGSLAQFEDQASAHQAVRGQRPFFMWVDRLVGRA